LLCVKNIALRPPELTNFVENTDVIPKKVVTFSLPAEHKPPYRHCSQREKKQK